MRGEAEEQLYRKDEQEQIISGTMDEERREEGEDSVYARERERAKRETTEEMKKR